MIQNHTLTHLETQLCRLRDPNFGSSSGDLNQPVATWYEADLFHTQQIQALAIILRTSGCSWARNHGGCTVCGYTQDSALNPPQFDHIKAQISVALQKAKSTPISVIKIFTSGSFFDETEIPPITRQYILEQLSDLPHLQNVILETRPEYVQSENLDEAKRILGNISLEIAIGLETSNDQIRETCIHKGFTYQDFIRAAKLIRSQECDLRAYLLLKPPFLTEQEAIDDSITSAISAVSDGATTVSINPITIHAGTLIERLWLQKYYRHPWLWSIIDTLNEIRANIPPTTNVICHPVAGGKRRGPHNCGRCDKRVLQAIRTFSLSQDLTTFADLNCTCKLQWNTIKQLESLNREPLLYEMLTPL